jgi:hypothetical protein
MAVTYVFDIIVITCRIAASWGSGSVAVASPPPGSTIQGKG